ncbi:MAG: DNA alkylation repair protein [Pontiella sp.]
MAEQRLMKDGLGKDAIGRIAKSLAHTVPDFPGEDFTADALDGIQSLELKDRVRHLIAVLHDFLPQDFEQAAEILVALKSGWDRGDAGDNLAGFAAWPIIDYIGEYGLDHPATSLKALRELTSMFSAEFAIRPFIINHFELTFQTMEAWTNDADEHVRRLISEGSRPRLPWGQQLPQFIADPAPVFQLLEKLKDDPSEYVRRSVANNLNDISKDHPEYVIALCKRWKKTATPERQWIIRHATRTLVKAGHPAVFGLLGYTENLKLSLQSLDVSPKAIQLGEAVEFKAAIKSASKQSQKVVIDYAIHHMKANGKTSPKVFKFRTLEIASGETVDLTKRHAIKPITTRKYYSGEHAIEILINGKTFGKTTFTLRLD